MGAQAPDAWGRALTSEAQCDPEFVTLWAFCPGEFCHSKIPGRNVVAMVGLGLAPKGNSPLSLPSLSKHQDDRTDIDNDLSRVLPLGVTGQLHAY